MQHWEVTVPLRYGHVKGSSLLDNNEGQFDWRMEILRVPGFRQGHVLGRRLREARSSLAQYHLIWSEPIGQARVGGGSNNTTSSSSSIILSSPPTPSPTHLILASIHQRVSQCPFFAFPFTSQSSHLGQDIALESLDVSWLRDAA